MKIIITLLLILATHLNVWAAESHHEQGQRGQMAMLRGEVRSSDGKAVQFASVFVEGANQYGATTDQNGRFHLRLPAGEHTIIATFLGFDSQQKSINIAPRSETMVEFTLTPSAMDIEDVVVTSTGLTREIQERGFAVSSVNTMGSLASSVDMNELLNRASGITIRQSGGAGSDVEYSINGLSGNSVGIYIDGVPIRSYGPAFSIGSIPPAMIERVEVYKGVVPAHLADDALGGVINVVLKKSTINSLTASYSYGSYNTHNGEVNGQYRNEKGFTAGAAAYYTYSDNNYDVWGDVVLTTDEAGQPVEIVAERFHDSYETMGVSANVGASQVKWADNFRVNLLYSSIDKDIQHGATMATVYGARRSEQSTYVANATYEKKNLLHRLDASAAASFSKTERMVIDTTTMIYDWTGYVGQGTIAGEAGDATLETNLERNYTTRLNLKYNLDERKRHSISANGAFTRFTRDLDDPYLSEISQALLETRYIDKLTLAASYDISLFDDRLKGSIFYKFFDQQMRLIDPYTETTGSGGGTTVIETYAKEYTNNSGGSSYGAALSYAILPNVMVTLSGEKALRLPGITELLGNTGDNIEPNYNLKPETSMNFNAGVLLGPFKFGRSRVDLDMNIFYRDVTNMIERETNESDDDMVSYTNIGAILSKGADLEFKYSYDDRLSINGATSYTKAVFNIEYDQYGRLYAYYGDKLRNQPFFTANADASYTWRDLFARGSRLSVSYYFNYVHSFFRDWECFGSAEYSTIIPTQLSHDFGLVYHFPKDKIALSFDAKNILNEQLFDNYALQKPGRMIYGKITYKIF